MKLCRTILTLVAGSVLAIAGCAKPDKSSIARPNLLRPGTADLQQARAKRFDPYPENEPGPRINEARPREYDRPYPEVDRARWTFPPVDALGQPIYPDSPRHR
jgi:hypothetical protein